LDWLYTDFRIKMARVAKIEFEVRTYIRDHEVFQQVLRAYVKKSFRTLLAC